MAQIIPSRSATSSRSGAPPLPSTTLEFRIKVSQLDMEVA
jgi:hypothetical protein